METGKQDSASKNTPPDDTKQEPLKDEIKSAENIPDECGDTLWDKVLAQGNELKSVLKDWLPVDDQQKDGAREKRE